VRAAILHYHHQLYIWGRERKRGREREDEITAQHGYLIASLTENFDTKKSSVTVRLAITFHVWLLIKSIIKRAHLMNAHALKGDAAACERVMRDMQKAGLVEHTDERSRWENRCCCVRTGDADHAEGGA
jgi:hypothetical protein